VITLLRALSAVLLATTAFIATAAAAEAQYPARAVRVVVGFPPGGISDALSRVISQQLSAAWGHQFVVDNRPGAGTTLAAALVSKSAPDAYTLYFCDVTTHAINATLYTSLPYDPVKDFTPITMVAQTPLILVVHPSVPVRNVKELVALAKKHPGEMNYASSGNGTILHLAGETLKSRAGVDLIHIPYKGSAPAVAAVIGGEASTTFSTTPAALPQVKAGKLRALAVTSARRSPTLPDVPSMAESLPGYEIVLYSGIMGPAGLPTEAVGRLQSEITRILAQPKTREAWAAFGADPLAMPSAEFTAHLKSEIVKLGGMVKAAGAKVE
jgi:tripartite-type tricarboxylate transporter receptor subunit TctC